MRARILRLVVAASLVAPVYLGRAPTTAAMAPRLTARVWVTGYDDVGYTFSGIWTHPGTCAVDPRVIPLGTYITVYGLWTCHAEDTGSAVIGYHVDMWVPTAAQAYAITGWYTASWGAPQPSGARAYRVPATTATAIPVAPTWTAVPPAAPTFTPVPPLPTLTPLPVVAARPSSTPSTAAPVTITPPPPVTITPAATVAAGRAHVRHGAPPPSIPTATASDYRRAASFLIGLVRRQCHVSYVKIRVHGRVVRQRITTCR